MYSTSSAGSSLKDRRYLLAVLIAIQVLSCRCISISRGNVKCRQCSSKNVDADRGKINLESTACEKRMTNNITPLSNCKYCTAKSVTYDKGGYIFNRNCEKSSVATVNVNLPMQIVCTTLHYIYCTHARARTRTHAHAHAHVHSIFTLAVFLTTFLETNSISAEQNINILLIKY